MKLEDPMYKVLPSGARAAGFGGSMKVEVELTQRAYRKGKFILDLSLEVGDSKKAITTAYVLTEQINLSDPRIEWSGWISQKGIPRPEDIYCQEAKN